jgi:hypothetical protein
LILEMRDYYSYITESDILFIIRALKSTHEGKPIILGEFCLPVRSSPKIWERDETGILR